MAAKTERINFRISDEFKQLIQEAADQQHISLTAWIMQALSEATVRQEAQRRMMVRALVNFDTILSEVESESHEA